MNLVINEFCPTVRVGWRRKPFYLYNVPDDVMRWVRNPVTRLPAIQPMGVTATEADFVWRHFGKRQYARVSETCRSYEYWANKCFMRYGSYLLSLPQGLSVMDGDYGSDWYAEPGRYWHLRYLASNSLIDWSL